MTEERPMPNRAARLLPAATFLVGLLVGGVVIGVGLGGSGNDASGETTPASTTAPTSDASPDVAVTIPAACQKAASAINKAVILLRDGASSVRDFDPDHLVAVLNQLEDLDPQIRALADRCSQVDVGTATPESPTSS